MTVKELIEKLQKCHPDLEVYVVAPNEADDMHFTISEVENWFSDDVRYLNDPTMDHVHIYGQELISG